MNTPTPEDEGFLNPDEYLKRIKEGTEPSRENVRKQVESITSNSPSSTETNNLSDEQRMNHAVSIAIEHGLVREEILPSKNPTAKTGYILSSSHYENYKYDLAEVDDQTRASQIQLFQLMHLVNQQGVQGPLYCEGRMHGRNYPSFPIDKPKITINGSEYDIHDPEAQQFLFEHPTALKDIMNMQLQAAEKEKTTAPIFYSYTSYANIQGAHTSRVEERMKNILSDAQWSEKFDEQFKFFTSTLDSGIIDFTVEKGWDKTGKPLVQLAGRWIYTKEIIPLIEYYLAFAEKLAEFDAMREEEMAALMTQTNEGQVPLCFCGLGHTLALAEKMKDKMNVHILTPTDSVYLDDQRRTLPINHPDAGLLNIDVYQKVLEVAKSVEDKS